MAAKKKNDPATKRKNTRNSKPQRKPRGKLCAIVPDLLTDKGIEEISRIDSNPAYVIVEYHIQRYKCGKLYCVIIYRDHSDAA